MHPITTTDLRTALTLMLPEQVMDGEGGWHTLWHAGPALWAHLTPLRSTIEKDLTHWPPPRYRIIVRAEIQLSLPLKFLWEIGQGGKHLLVRTTPILMQSNQFLDMIAEEEIHA